MPQTPPPDPGTLTSSDVQPDTRERILSGLGGAIAGGSGTSMQGTGLDKAIEAHHQRRLHEAQMHRDNASTYASAIMHGVDPKTGQPLTPEQEQEFTNKRDAAWAAYEKAAGVSKETKGALAKARMIVDQITGHAREAKGLPPASPIGAGPTAGGGAPTAPPASGAASTGASAPAPAGGAGGSPAPTPPPSSPPPKISPEGTSVSSGGYPITGAGGPRMTPPPAAAAGTGAAPQGPTPPPDYDAKTAALEAPQLRRMLDTRIALQDKIAGQVAEEEAHVETRRRLAKEIGLDPNSRDYKEWLATGKFPTGAGGLQKATVMVDGAPTLANYDKTTGTYSDVDTGQVIQNAQPFSAGMLTPHEIHYKDAATGRPLIGFRVDKKLYGQDGQQLPPGTEFYARGNVPTETLRQTITYGPDGTPQINTLETIRKPIYEASGFGGGGAPRGGAAAPSKGAGASSARATRQTPPPGGAASGDAPVARDATGKPLGTSAGMYTQTRKSMTPVREATTQIFGDPKNPDLRTIKDFAYIADDPVKSKLLGNALQLTFRGLEQQEKSAGGPVTLLKNYAGIPQDIVASQTAIMQDVIGKLPPDVKEAYDATMTAYATTMGVRSSTGQNASMYSSIAIEREIPTPGLYTHSKAQYYDQLAHLGEVVQNAAAQLPFPKAEKDYIDSQVQEMRKQARESKVRKSKGKGIPPPPGGGPTTADEYLQMYRGTPSAAAKP